MRYRSQSVLLCFFVCFLAHVELLKAQAVKLPWPINLSDQSQLAPVVSADGKTLYFTRPRLAIDSSTVFDIWRAAIINDTLYGQPDVMSGRLASRYGIAVTSVSPDNNSLYIMGKLKEDTPPEERIYVTRRTSTDWSIPEPIRIRNLNVRGVYTDYSFGPDQKSLIMSVERDSTLGGRDLYVSFYDETRNTWSTPMSLGAQVNSAYEEMTPFMAADGKTLFFSSSRPGGFGEVDVYRTDRLDDTWQKWSAAENMGPGINSRGRTLYYTQDVRNKWAYFVHRPNTTEPAALYRAPVTTRSTPVVTVHGKVLDESGKPLLARIRYERLSDGRELGTARSNPATGEYQISLAAGEDYAARAELDGYIPRNEHIDLRKTTFSVSLERDLILSRLNKGAVIVLNNIFFETDRSTLLPTSLPELQRLASLLEKRPQLSISIEGHTDSLGTGEHNIALSKGRAEAVREYLVQHGIDQKRLLVEAFGSSKPLASNTSEEGRAKNRRVQFRVVGNE
jgi:OmpA-OmpF porin, OOP family